MKKFTFKGVFDGLRSSVAQPSRFGTVEEFLRPEDFEVAKTVRYGFPHQPTALAFDPIQRIIAVGSKSGSIRFIGRPGVDLHVRHESEAAVLQLLFLVNEGALVSACADDSLHLWNFRQKTPSVVNTLTFSRERITCCHLPFQSKWLYIGTERGNIHVVNIESFVLSGYVINWNKAIELQRKTHPGPVIHISDNPADPNKLLIGFECGQVVLWDLRSRTAEARFQTAEPLCSISWNQEGKQFICSHTDGSLTTWSIRQPPRPITTFYPHAKTNKEGKMETCKSIQKVEWKSCRNGESYVVFNGGLSTGGGTPSITVIHGKMTTVLEMEHNVIDFICLSGTPYSSECQEPYAVLVLLQNDLVAVDLQTSGYPCFENPYPMDVHESPVTHIFYLADCPMDAIPSLYSVGCKTQKRTGFSEREWPISGGDWGTSTASYPELIITGHADGSVKFWDASAISFQVLYKLKTAKLFEKAKGNQDDPLAITQMSLCPESRLLALVGAAGQIMLFKFSKIESTEGTAVLEVPIIHECFDDFECSPEVDYPPRYVPNGLYPDSDKKNAGNLFYPLRVRGGITKRTSGYQADLICLTPTVNGVPPGSISSVAVNATYGMMAYGNDSGLVVIDIIQKTCLLNLGIPDMYGTADPYQRTPRSPKSKSSGIEIDDRCKSPCDDQMCVTPWVNQAGPRGAGATDNVNSPRRQAEQGLVKRCKSQGLQRCPTIMLEGGESPPDTPLASPHSQRMRSLLAARQSKSLCERVDSSFSRSRSSSMSSLDNISSESITTLVFVESYTRKEDTSLSPTMWVGTSLGSVLIFTLNLPTGEEARANLPAIVSPSGTLFRLKGSILTVSFIDCTNVMSSNMPEEPKEKEKDKSKNRNRQSPTQERGNMEGISDWHLVVMTSEKQARVVALPSQTCVFRINLVTTEEKAFVIKSEVISLKDNVCLVCYSSSGHITAYSLPSLRPLLDIDFLPLPELSFQTRKPGIVDPMLSIWGQQMFVNEDTDQITRTFCFSNHGHGVYLCSPSEIQKFTISADFASNIGELVGDMFLPCEMPEPPKESFFKGLFGGGVRSLDREELFGETGSGRPPRGVTKNNPTPPNMERIGSSAGSATGEVSRARKMLIERGEKLTQVDDRTERMASEAEAFSNVAHNLMLKYKDRKWYHL